MDSTSVLILLIGVGLVFYGFEFFFNKSFKEKIKLWSKEISKSKIDAGLESKSEKVIDNIFVIRIIIAGLILVALFLSSS